MQPSRSNFQQTPKLAARRPSRTIPDKVAQAEWTVGQLTVWADTQIGTLEDVTKDED